MAAYYYTADNPPSPNVDKMLLTMLLEGYSPEQAYGWIGNAQQESYQDLKTTVEGDQGEAKGIFQWHASRQAALRNYAKQQGRDWDDIVTQTLFSLYETGEGRAHKMLSSATTIEQAVDAGIAYTRPGRPARDNRLNNALELQRWYTHDHSGA